MRQQREDPDLSASSTYKHALQELIKCEIQALVERLSDTGEEALVLTASLTDNTCTQLGSTKGDDFLTKQASLKDHFLAFCNDEPDQSSVDDLSDDGLEVAEKFPDKGRVFTERHYSNSITGKDVEGTDNSLEGLFKPEMDKIITDDTKPLPGGHVKERQSTKSRSDPQLQPDMDVSASERPESLSSTSSTVDGQESLTNDLQCRICQRTFRSHQTLTQHIRLHMVKSYKCGVCGKIFSVKASYKRHLRIHNQDKRFDCDLCSKYFTDQYSLKRHRERHLDVRSYTCDLCGKSFYEKYSLRVHQTGHFYSTLKSDKSADKAAGYSCHICQKLMKTKAAMKTHLLTHAAKKFACEFCPKRFALKYSYVRHRRIHTGETPYRCATCDRAFSDGSAWSKHIQTHSGVKPFSCDVCNKAFFNKATCRNHQRQHQIKNLTKVIQKTSVQDVVERTGSRIKNTRNKNSVDEDIVSDNIENSYDKSGFDISDAGMHIYPDELKLVLEDSDKEYEGSLVDAGFGTALLPAGDKHETKQTQRTCNSDQKFNTILDNVTLDETFQAEFVDRHMPDKGIESDADLLATNFLDESDILENDADFGLDDTEISGNERKSIPGGPKAAKHSSPVRMPTTPSQSPRKSKRKKKTLCKYVTESPAKCKTCKKAFKQDWLLKQHMQLHCLLKKLYRCQYCEKQLSSHQSLARHVRTHTGERPYICYICQMTFADKSSCIRHIRYHLTADNGTKTPDSDKKTGSKTSKRRTKEKKVVEPNIVSDIEGDCLSTDETSNEMVTTATLIQQRSPEYSKSNVVSHNRSPTFSQSDKLSHQRSQSFSQSDVLSHHLNPEFNQSNTHRSPDFSQSDALSRHRSPDFHQPESLSHHSSQPADVPIIKTGSGLSVCTSDTKQAQACRKLYKCSLCESMFDTEEQCQNHINTLHQTIEHSKPSNSLKHSQNTNISEPQDVDSGQKPQLFRCSLCGAVFQTEDLCQIHIQTQCSNSLVSSQCAVQSLLDSEADSIPPFGHPLSIDRLVSLSDLPLDDVPLSDLHTADDLVTAASTITPQFSTDSPLQCSDPMPDIPIHVEPAPSSIAQPHDNVTFLYTGGELASPTASYNQLQLLGTKSLNLDTAGFTQLNQLPGQQRVTLLLSKPAGISKATDSTQKQTSSQKQQPDPVDKPTQPVSSSETTCNVCNKTFTTKYILRQHDLIHMEKKFPCKYCSKKFHKKYDRDRHVRVHTRETPYSCPKCKRAFQDNSWYRKHVRQCVGE